MTTKITLAGTSIPVVIAALAASTLFAGTVQADTSFPVNATVHTAGLDLTQESGVRELYSRLEVAAGRVCNNVYRVGLQPVTDYTDCYEKSLAAAVQSADKPRLTQVYLRAHTLKDATAHGITASVLTATASPRR